jgi:hypothetical protein
MLLSFSVFSLTTEHMANKRGEMLLKEAHMVVLFYRENLGIIYFQKVTVYLPNYTVHIPEHRGPDTPCYKTLKSLRSTSDLDSAAVYASDKQTYCQV